MSCPGTDALAWGRSSINEELIGAQGNPVDIGCYYRPDHAKTGAVSRPPTTFNAAVAGLTARQRDRPGSGIERGVPDPLVIVGCGGAGREVLDIVAALNRIRARVDGPRFCG